METTIDPTDPEVAPAQPEPTRGYLLALLSVGHGVTHWFPGTMSVCLPLIVRDFGISYIEIGALRSFQRMALMISVTIGGLATDLMKDRKGILLLSVLWPSFFFALQGFPTTFFMFGLLLCVQALLGGFLWHAPARAVIGEKFPDRMGFALGVHAMGANLAASIAPLAVGALLAWVSWRTAYKLQFFPGILVAVFLWWVLPKLGRRKADKEREASYSAAFRADILKNVPLMSVTLVAGLRSIGENLIPTFLPLYLATELGMGTAGISLYLACLALVGTVFAPVAGHASDRWGRKPTIALSLLCGGLLIGAIPLFPSGILLLPVVALGGMSLFAVGPIIQASGLEHAPRHLWGVAQTFMDVGRSTLSLVFPLIAGAVADAYGLRYTFYLFGAVNLGAAATMLAVPNPKERT